jgi:hypothetical protein
MPRPTAAQLASGSATVVFSALALLLFTRTTHGLGVAAIGVVSLALGVLVAAALPPVRAARPERGTSRRVAGSAGRVTVPRAHAGAGADSRVGRTSLPR